MSRQNTSSDTETLVFSGELFFSEHELITELEEWLEADRQYQPRLNPDQISLFDTGIGTDADIPFH